VSEHRVLLLHNRYRVHGGEEREDDLQLAALRRGGIEHHALFRDSADAGKAQAARALVRGGDSDAEVAAAVSEFRPTVVHAHNIHPLLGPRALAAARAEGARVVMTLHNFRLFCAIGVSFRFGEPCFRCHGRWTAPGLALNCRGSVPEAAVYAYALSAHQPLVFESVDRFIAPSGYAAGQLAKLGVPDDRLATLPHYIPAPEFAESSRADRGEFALGFGRLAGEKGFDCAIDAAAIAGVPLKIAGDGPDRVELQQRIERDQAPVELLGRIPGDRLRDLIRRAAMVVVPSRGNETFGFAALEAMACGVPVVATESGALPELAGPENCVRRSDALALASRMEDLWGDPPRRKADGDAALARARELFSESRFLNGLLRIYDAP
jgi:glycosyltransferase involved in cell wall biosynthesis